MTPETWPSGRLNDRFAAIAEDLRDIREQVRVFAPMVKTTYELDVRASNLEEDLRELHRAIVEVRDECRRDHAQVMGRLQSQDDRREIARTELRKVIIQAGLALVGTVVVAGGTVLAAVLT